MRSCNCRQTPSIRSFAAGDLSASALISLRTSSIRLLTGMRNLNSESDIHGDGRRYPGNLPDSFRAIKYFGMNRKRQCIKPLQKGGGRRVQELIPHTVNAKRASGASPLPFTVSHDLLEWDAVPCSAPGNNHNLRIHSSYFFSGNLLTRNTDKFAAGSFNQFSHPGLRCDQRLAPLLAENSWPRQSGSTGADFIDPLFHVGNQLLAPC